MVILLFSVFKTCVTAAYVDSYVLKLCMSCLEKILLKVIRCDYIFPYPNPSWKKLLNIYASPPLPPPSPPFFSCISMKTNVSSFDFFECKVLILFWLYGHEKVGDSTSNILAYSRSAKYYKSIFLKIIQINFHLSDPFFSPTGQL